MANALGGAAQTLPIANNLQSSGVNQTSSQQAQELASQEEGNTSQTLRTEEQQRTNETTEFRTDVNEEQAQTADASASQTPSISSGNGERGSNIDILV